MFGRVEMIDMAVGSRPIPATLLPSTATADLLHTTERPQITTTA